MSKLTGLSLFSNVGVAEAYFKEIGVNIVLANELLEERSRFYSEVYKDTEMICGDITDENIQRTIIERAKEVGVDFISFDETLFLGGICGLGFTVFVLTAFGFNCGKL